jgi:hypothetical protein
MGQLLLSHPRLYPLVPGVTFVARRFFPLHSEAITAIIEANP